MSQPVKLSDILEGMEFASDEMSSYFDRTTGKVVTIPADALTSVEDGEEPDDLADWDRNEYEAAHLIAADDSGQFVALPDHFDIDEYRMMKEFSRGVSDAAASNELSRAISGPGVFRYFKDTVHRLGLADDWYRYRDAAYADVAREWCEAEGVAFVDDMPSK